MNNNTSSCQCLSDFMKDQMEIVKKHLDEHKYLRHIEDNQNAMISFLEDYGWLFRELYCTKICDKRDNCEISKKLSKFGDLLKNHIK